MKTRLVYMIIGMLLILVLALGALALHAQSTYQGQQWEYLTLDWLGAAGNTFYEDVGSITINGEPPEPGPPQKLSDVLNEYGAEGWELIAVEQRSIPLRDEEFNELTRYILKRARL